jgi:hypothetical protein
MSFAGIDTGKTRSFANKMTRWIPSVGSILANRRAISVLAIVFTCLFSVLAGREISERPVLVLGGAIGAIVLAWLAVRPATTVIFVMTYTPFEEFLLKFVPGQAYAVARYLPELLLISALGLLLVGRAIRRKPLEGTPMDVPLLLFLAVSLFSILYNRIPLVVGVLELRILLRYVVLLYILVLGEFDKQFIARIFRIMLVIVAVQVGLGLLHSVLGDRASAFLAPGDVTIGDIFVRMGFAQIVSSHTRIFSTFGRYNLYGNFLAFFLLFVIAVMYVQGSDLSHGQNQRLRLFLLAGLAAMVLSFSRMSWIGFYAGLVVMLSLMKKRRVIAYLVVPIAVTYVLFRFYGPSSVEVSETGEASIMQRYLGMFSPRYAEISLNSDRLYAMTKTTGRVMQISPVLGLGPGSVASAAAKIFGGGERWEVLDLPTSKVMALGDVGWAAMLAQYGLLGLALFIWILVRIFRSSIQSYRLARDSLERILAVGFIGGFVCMMFENVFSFNFTYRPSALYFWMFAGIVFRMLKIQKSEEGSS